MELMLAAYAFFMSSILVGALLIGVSILREMFADHRLRIEEKRAAIRALKEQNRPPALSETKTQELLEELSKRRDLTN